LHFRLGKPKVIPIDMPAFTLKEAISIVDEAKSLLIEDAENEANRYRQFREISETLPREEQDSTAAAKLINELNLWRDS